MCLQKQINLFLGSLFHVKIVLPLLTLISLLSCCGGNPDPCNGLCENGGTCKNGLCDCPENTMGNNCEILLPSRLEFTNLTYKSNNPPDCPGFGCIEIDMFIIIKDLNDESNFYYTAPLEVPLQSGCNVLINPILDYSSFLHNVNFNAKHNYSIEVYRMCSNNDQIIEPITGRYATLFGEFKFYPFGNFINGIPTVNIDLDNQISVSWKWII